MGGAERYGKDFEDNRRAVSKPGVAKSRLLVGGRASCRLEMIDPRGMPLLLSFAQEPDHNSHDRESQQEKHNSALMVEASGKEPGIDMGRKDGERENANGILNHGKRDGGYHNRYLVPR